MEMLGNLKQVKKNQISPPRPQRGEMMGGNSQIQKSEVEKKFFTSTDCRTGFAEKLDLATSDHDTWLHGTHDQGAKVYMYRYSSKVQHSANTKSVITS